MTELTIWQENDFSDREAYVHVYGEEAAKLEELADSKLAQIHSLEGASIEKYAQAQQNFNNAVTKFNSHSRLKGAKEKYLKAAIAWAKAEQKYIFDWECIKKLRSERYSLLEQLEELKTKIRASRVKNY